MTNEFINPVRDWYTVVTLKKSEISEGGIVLPGDKGKDLPFGRVLARGPGKPSDFVFDFDRGKFPVLPMSAKVGDIIFFASPGAKKCKLSGVGDVFLVNEIDIIGVIDHDCDDLLATMRENEWIY